MASQANVFQGAISNQVMSTDKVSISSGNATVTYNVFLANLTSGSNTGDSIYSNAVSVGAGLIVETYVGVGNFLTIVGNTATTQELGTASSARSGVIGTGA